MEGEKQRQAAKKAEHAAKNFSKTDSEYSATNAKRDAFDRIKSALGAGGSPEDKDDAQSKKGARDVDHQRAVLIIRKILSDAGGELEVAPLLSKFSSVDAQLKRVVLPRKSPNGGSGAIEWLRAHKGVFEVDQMNASGQATVRLSGADGSPAQRRQHHAGMQTKQPGKITVPEPSRRPGVGQGFQSVADAAASSPPRPG